LYCSVFKMQLPSLVRASILCQPFSVTAYLLYHISDRLSSPFQNFFQKFFRAFRLTWFRGRRFWRLVYYITDLGDCQAEEYAGFI
ncbi:MAG: hypothetical protein K5695_13780, partial [Oscillospiraceae bacterium]|nr:hypothetical protein [Oscillospiraceae bacterium]